MRVAPSVRSIGGGQLSVTQHVARTSRRALVRARAAPTAQETLQQKLQDGIELELLHQAPDQDKQRPPLLFVHGSYHAAWCWQEHFMPYFAGRGYDCWAVSLRAQGGSGGRGAGGVAGTLDSHAEDLGQVVAGLPSPPVVVGHSFGGLIVQKYLLRSCSQAGGGACLPDLPGAALLASVPPSGNKAMVGRFMRRDPLLSLRLTWAFVAKSFATSEAACREAFFSDDLPQQELLRYQSLLAGCSPVRLLDLRDMNAATPLPPPPRPAALPPLFVAGGEQDKVVDVEAVQELARYYGVSPTLLPDMAHDLMLDTRWGEAAVALATWLDSLPPAAPAPATAAGSSSSSKSSS